MPAIALDKPPTLRQQDAARFRFGFGARRWPRPTVHAPSPLTVWTRWAMQSPLLCTDGCKVPLSGMRCDHGHPTFFLRMFLDLGE